MKLQDSLGYGATYFINDHGDKVWTGSMMGRSNVLPKDKNESVKLRMQRLDWFDGDYDKGGAYWGRNGVNHVYFATGQASDVTVEIFVRAQNRVGAKEFVLDILPNARFYS